MTPEEREKLPPDEQAVFCAAFAASYVMHVNHDSWDKRNNAKWNASEDAKLAVAAFQEDWKS